MSKSSLYRSSADSNPNQQHLHPKEKMGIQFPILTRHKTSSRVPIVALAALMLAGFAYFWLANIITGVSDPRAVVYVTFMISTGLFAASGRLAIAFWGTVAIAVVEAAIYAYVTGKYDATYEMHVLAIGATLFLAIRFRTFVRGLAFSGYYSDTERDNYATNRKLPIGIQLKKVSSRELVGLFKAWFNYDSDDSSFSGAFKPKLNNPERLAAVIFCLVLWTGASVLTGLSRIAEGPAEFPAAIAAAATMPTLIVLTVVLILNSNEIDRVVAVMRQQFSVTRWHSFIWSNKFSRNAALAGGIYLGTVRSDGAPALMAMSQLVKSGWIQGAPGSGKTAMMSQMIEQLIIQGKSVVVLDLKATSHELLQAEKNAVNLVQKIEKRDVPHHIFTPMHNEATQLFDLFSQEAWAKASPEDKASMMLGFMGLNYGNVYGKNYFRDSAWTVQQHLLDKYAKIESFHEAATLLAEELKHAKEPWELSAASKRDGEHPRLILKRLGMNDCINRRSSYSQEVLDSAIKIDTLFETPSVLHCALPSVSDPVGNPEIGRIILGSLLKIAADMPSRNCEVIVFVDEFQRLCGREIDLVLQQARSLGVGLVLSNQSSADLHVVDPTLVDTIAACTQFQMWMKTTDNLGKQQIKDFGGQYIDQMYSKTLGTNGKGEQTSSQTSSEQLFDRVSDGLIDEVNSTQGDYFLRITENAGYAAYGSELFVAHMDLSLIHISEPTRPY